jgi:transposase-like protein
LLNRRPIVQILAQDKNQNKNPRHTEVTPKSQTRKESTFGDNCLGGAFLMAGQKGMTHYPAELKQRAVALYLEEGQSYGAIAQTLAIRDSARIKKWVQAYRQEGALGLCKVQGRPRQQPSNDLARLQLENALLKKWHSELRRTMRAKRNIG